MLARVLYSAIVLCVLGALPRAAPRPAAETGERTMPAAADPGWWPRCEGVRTCRAEGALGIARNPPDFAIPRIDR